MAVRITPQKTWRERLREPLYIQALGILPRSVILRIARLLVDPRHRLTLNIITPTRYTLVLYTQQGGWMHVAVRADDAVDMGTPTHAVLALAEDLLHRHIGFNPAREPFVAQVCEDTRDYRRIAHTMLSRDRGVGALRWSNGCIPLQDVLSVPFCMCVNDCMPRELAPELYVPLLDHVDDTAGRHEVHIRFRLQ